VTRYRVTITERARRELVRAAGWWKANRKAAQDLFVEEIEATFALLASTPATGTAAPSHRYPGLRRRILSRTRYFVYYTVDADVVVVRSIWHGQRGKRPRLT
jgi:plasmid stabilization system protein ParE